MVRALHGRQHPGDPVTFPAGMPTTTPNGTMNELHAELLASAIDTARQSRETEDASEAAWYSKAALQLTQALCTLRTNVASRGRA